MAGWSIPTVDLLVTHLHRDNVRLVEGVLTFKDSMDQQLEHPFKIQFSLAGPALCPILAVSLIFYLWQNDVNPPKRDLSTVAVNAILIERAKQMARVLRFRCDGVLKAFGLASRMHLFIQMYKAFFSSAGRKTLDPRLG